MPDRLREIFVCDVAVGRQMTMMMGPTAEPAISILLYHLPTREKGR